MVSFFFVMTFNETKQCHNIQGQEDSSGLLVFWRLTINPQTFARSLRLWRPSLFCLLHLVTLLPRAQKTVLNVALTRFTTLGIQYLHSGSAASHKTLIYRNILLFLVYDRNHYFSFGPIPKPKPKLVDSFGRYRNRYRNHISKGKSSYQ